MNEQEAILAELGDVGSLDGIRWAYRSAARRTAEDFDEATGHNAMWVGVTRWVIFCDRLDRVFSCGRYATTGDGEGDPGAGLDVLYATLTETERDSLPQIEPGVVVRSDLQGSPGWKCGGVRWLLASAEFGTIDHIPWTRKSSLKQRAASQPNPDGDQMSILDVMVDDPVAALLAAVLEQADPLDLRTLVVAHSQDVETADQELVIGLPSLENGSAWAWRRDLLAGPPTGPQTRQPRPEPQPPSDVTDAPVRLRRLGQKSGEQRDADSSAPRSVEGR